MDKITFRVADVIEAHEISDVVNAAYRPASGSGGWTHEAHLVQGDRTSPGQVEQLIEKSTVLVGVANDSIVASAHIDMNHSAAYIGMLAVRPGLQGAGLGAAILRYAESYARSALGAAQIALIVLRARPELLAYYERRGYQRTGEVRPYPSGEGVGTPIDAGLELEVMLKRTTTQSPS